MCHRTGKADKWIKITIDDSAEQAHLDHGDYLGVCGSVDSAPELQVMGCKDPYLSNLIDAIQINNDSGEEGGEPADRGIIGGHFDLDTSTTISNFGAGSTNKHVHEWDDKNNLTTIDFFNIIGDGFDNIDETFASSQKFILTVANSALSPGGTLRINGINENVVDTENRVKNALSGRETLPIYKFAAPTAAEKAAGIRQLSNFSLSFDPNVIAAGGLIPTNTGCVRDNDPGANNEYRNGSLLIQALSADSNTIHPSLGYAQEGLLWEATVFWHWDPSECYGDGNWQARFDQCAIDGSCISPSKISSKAKTVANNDKINVCHRAGKSGTKFVKLNISKSAACAHLGFVPDAAGADTGAECVPTGHTGDHYIVDKSASCTDATAEYDADDETSISTLYQQALEECLDPTKGGGYMGTGKTGRINWKEIINN
jgi:hypothetical protein